MHGEHGSRVDPKSSNRPRRVALQDDWNAAAADAGVAPESVTLYPLRATGNHGAMYFAPGVVPHAWDTEFAYTDDDRDRLRELVDEQVLVIQQDLTHPHRLLLLRHEAEHVAQEQASPAASVFALRLAIALPQGADWLYMAMPHERDADAAATAFRVAHQIDATPADLEGVDRMLYGAPWPAPNRESLPLRLLAFSLFFPGLFDVACRANQYWPAVDPDALIEDMIAGGAAVRNARRNLVSGYIEEITDHGVTPEMFEAMTRAEQLALNDEVRAALVEKEAEIVDDLRAALR